MTVEAIALTNFTHGNVDATAGQVCRHRDGTPINQSLAEDLERAGLVRIRTVKSTPQGKAAGDGRGQPSSASQAAPASTKPTSVTLKRGSGKTQKSAA